MLLTAIELQGGQANIEGNIVTVTLYVLAIDCHNMTSRKGFLNFYFSDLVTAMTTKKG